MIPKAIEFVDDPSNYATEREYITHRSEFHKAPARVRAECGAAWPRGAALRALRPGPAKAPGGG